MGGHTHHPNYHLVCSKTTGHAEVVEITYDPKEISFETLLKGFFSLHDSTRDRSGRGGQYRSVVFWRKREERTFLEQQLEELLAAGLSVSTSIEKASIFWEAEPRHQGYVTRTGRHCELLTTNDIFNETIAEVVRKRIR